MKESEALQPEVKEEICPREGISNLHEAGSVFVKAGASLQSEVKEEV